VDIYPNNILIAPGVFSATFNVLNPATEDETVVTRLGCIVHSQFYWFEDDPGPPTFATQEEVILAQSIGHMGGFILRDVMAEVGCEGAPFKGKDIYLYVMSGEFVEGSSGATIIMGSTEFQEVVSTTTTASTTTTTTLPDTGGVCDYVFGDVLSPAPECVGEGNTFFDDINWLADSGITRGCNPPVNDQFCPKEFVTRGQMAAFLVRALGYTDDAGGNLFIDDDQSVFEGDIDRLGAAGAARGCNPPVNDRYCPGSYVTRGQMAAFLVRALGYTDDGGGDLFVDDDESVFEGDIDRLGTAGVTRGCNPPVNDRYCPGSYVTREQMAAFLHRALG